MALAGENPVALANVMNIRMDASRRVAICAEALAKLKGLMTPAQWRKYGWYMMYCARFGVHSRPSYGCARSPSPTTIGRGLPGAPTWASWRHGSSAR